MALGAYYFVCVVVVFFFFFPLEFSTSDIKHPHENISLYGFEH